MTRYFQALIDTGFAQGVTQYDEIVPGRAGSRIVLWVSLADGTLHPFVLDTGCPWSILHPAIARLLGNQLDRVERLPGALRVLDGSYRGWLCRTPVVIMASSGDSLEVCPTLFVPDESEWSHPNYLGMQTFLDYIRFAVDPAEKTFYFAAP